MERAFDPAKIIARMGPGTLLAELVGPGTAFRPTLTPASMSVSYTHLTLPTIYSV